MKLQIRASLEMSWGDKVRAPFRTSLDKPTPARIHRLTFRGSAHVSRFRHASCRACANQRCPPSCELLLDPAPLTVKILQVLATCLGINDELHHTGNQPFEVKVASRTHLDVNWTAGVLVGSDNEFHARHEFTHYLVI